jgi:hypothetical protein
VCQQTKDAVAEESKKVDEPNVQESTDIQVMVLSKVIFVQLY